MKEQYQKEISRIHVPTEILEKTKQAMKEEEEKTHAEKSGKILNFSRISVAAAAVLLLIMIPAATRDLEESESAMDAGAASEESVQMHLSEQPEVEFQAIAQDKNWFEELIDTIKELFD